MKPERHIWEEGSTHRTVAGKEYDEVWDYVEQLEAEVAGLRDYKMPDHEIADSAHWWKEKHDELQAENHRLREAIQEIVDGEEHYMGKESAIDYDGTIEAICDDLRKALENAT